MSHSLAQHVSLSCPQCNHHFDAEVWLIVETAERPDLLAKIKDGSLHQIVCPHCGAVSQVDAPLLVFIPPPCPLPTPDRSAGARRERRRKRRGRGAPPSASTFLPCSWYDH
ncbi:CpXC domain-containing protein [Chloroflexus sp.]|uniref:CpXC domain-containing protein n=1 Tax=Chloroflexus sp. TaxID=1904827 RepID=UPI0035B56F54